MSINYFEKQNILFGREVSTPENSPAYVTGSTSNKNSVENIPMVSQEAVEADVIGDSFKPTSTKPQNTQKSQNVSESQKEVKVCDVEKEILKQLANLNSKYNLGLTEENCLEFLAFSYLSSPQKMHSANIEEIKNSVKHLEDTIKAMEADGIEITMENLRAESRKYKGLINAGYDSVESYRKSVREGNAHSLTERLQAMGKSNFAELSKVEKLVFLREYLEETKTKAQWKARYNDVKNLSIRSREERRNAVETYVVTDFAKMVANSTPEERELLYQAVKDLNVSANGKYRALESIFAAFGSIEECQEFSETNCTAEAIHSITKTTKPEEAEDALRIVEIQTQYQSEEVFVRNGEEHARIAKEFFQENAESLREIQRKLHNGIRLTEEEKALYSEAIAFRHARTGMNRGVLTSQVINNPAGQVNVLEVLNHGTMQIAQVAGEDFYRNVLQQTATFIQQNPEQMTVTQHQAKAMMDATTRGNYSRVVSDAQNGTRTELTSHSVVTPEEAKKIYEAIEKYDGQYTSTAIDKIVEKVVNSNAFNNENYVKQSAQVKTQDSNPVVSEKKDTTKGALGFATKPVETKVTIETVNAKIQKLATQSKEVVEENQVEEKTVKSSAISEVALAVRTNGVEGLKAYVKENGTQKTILEILNDGENVPSYVKDLATTWYKKSNKQIDILSRASISAIKELLPVTNEEVLLNNKGKTFANYYATKLFNDKATEVEEENKKRNLA